MDLSTRGSNIVKSDCRVRGDTPASVRSPQAPLRRSKPCRSIIIETKSPIRVESEINKNGCFYNKESKMLTTNRIQGESREKPSTQDGEECNDTRICIAAMMDGIGQKHGTFLFISHDFGNTIQPFLRQYTDSSEPCGVRVNSVDMFVTNFR